MTAISASASAKLSVSHEARFRAQSFRAYLGPLAWIFVFGFSGWACESWLGDYPHLLMLLVISNVVLALSLNLVSGFTGQFSLGHAGFMSIGAYVSAYLAMNPVFGLFRIGIFPPSLDALNFLIYGTAGGLTAALAGFIVGLPSLRLRGDYLAIVTLGFGEIIRVALLNNQATGGARGLYGIPSPEALTIGSVVISPFVFSFFDASFWLILTFTALWRITHSAQGRAFMSVREDETAAEAMGVDSTRTKVRAFVISSFFAGAAGSIYAHAVQYLNPSTFDFTRSVQAVIMVVLGGMGSLTGSVVAAIAVTLIPELLLRPFQEWLRADFGFPDVDLRMAIFAFTLILFMILRPQGIFGSREIFALFSKSSAAKKRSGQDGPDPASSPSGGAKT